MSTKDKVSEEFFLLCTIHNIGATFADKSLSVREIINWTSIKSSNVNFHLNKLVEEGYLKFTKREDVIKYYLTPNGIRKVLSLYS